MLRSFTVINPHLVNHFRENPRYTKMTPEKILRKFVLHENIIIYKFKGSPRGTGLGNVSPSPSPSLFTRRGSIFPHLHPRRREPSPSPSPNGGIPRGESGIGALLPSLVYTDADWVGCLDSC
jgi:hypothetical protein